MLPRKFQIGLALGLLIVLCSIISDKVVSADERNVWHDGPINCYTCDNTEDCAASVGVARKCENNDAQTCLIVFDEAGAVAQRGCSQTVLSTFADYCEANGGHCLSCSSSGCNEATSLDQFTECVSCNSDDDKNCVLNPSEVTKTTKCFGECMTALYAVDSSALNPVYNLVRSCLNDRDLDEREACVEGKDEHCIACTEANCNKNALPKERHSCYHCEEDCEESEIQECTRFSESDRCFFKFDTTENNLIEMGCASKYSNEEEIEELIRKKELLICNGENCNEYGTLPDPNDCTRCSSDTLETCATNPTAVTTNENCNVQPYTQCYERVNIEAGGTTERGCLSQLENDDFYKCLTNIDENCRICTSDSCNEQVIPAERLQCQRCDSATDSSCHESPAALSVCSIYNQNDACVSVYENRITKRGCLSEFECDANERNCQICKDDGCNTLNVKQRSEELYGIFQDLPINCNTCVGAEECATDIHIPRKCEGDPFQDCLTIFDKTGAVIRRGCAALVEAEYQSYCDSDPELCFNCKSNGCNTITDASTYQECLYCDAATDANCLFNPDDISSTRKCTEGCLAALYKRKSNPDVSDFVRTCYEDIEPDDREECTEANNCIKCSDEKCNSQILPTEGRLKCLHCDSADCDMPQSKECTGYARDDQCYIYFDEVSHSTVRMGCKSEFPRSYISANLKQFYLCDDDDCNEYNNLPEAQRCFVCNSVTDENCISVSSKDTPQSRCQVYPYVECYTRITSDGHTERGCLHNLPLNDFVDCLEGVDNANCQVCLGTECNSPIYPANRQQCHRCNSVEDATCTAQPNAAAACPIYRTEDNCVTKLVNDITYRDCGSELSCSDSTYKQCSSCEGNNCNIANLYDASIGDPGIFQELPLNCYHCNDATECTNLGIVKKCEGNDLQTCGVVFDGTNGNVVARGCSDALEEVCNVNDNKCYECKSNGCNVVQEESDYIDCLFCDAKFGEACIFDVGSIVRTRKCYKGCVTALYARTNDDSPAYELIRTCLDDMDLDEREACEQGKDNNCKSCSTEKCNIVDLGTRKSCYHCEGESCQSPSEAKCRATMENDQCYIQFDENSSIVGMGCKSNYDPADIKLLLTAKRLWLCDDDNCNTFNNLPSSQNCAICNSITDANCAIAPQAVVSSTSCSNLPVTQCYTRILESGHTERGCLSSLEDDDFFNCFNGLNTAECAICTESDCNKELYPVDRLSCHVCSSDATSTCETAPQSAQTCLNYSSNEKCVSFINDSGFTVRGCSSQVTCDQQDSANCQVCTDNNCNLSNLRRKADGKPGLWQKLPLTCKSCASVADCASNVNQQVCSDEEYCMTVFEESGAVIARGCSNAVEQVHASYCDANSVNCYNCNSNECNDATSLNSFVECVYCDSATNPDCVANPTAVANRRKCNTNCMTALYPRAGSSVYELTRGCLDDKDLTDQQSCKNSGDANCAACSDNDCNTALIPATRKSCYSCLGESCEDPSSAVCIAYKENDQCFILFNDESDLIQMGCISDLADSFVENNLHLLHICSNEDNCNSFANLPTPKLCSICNSLEDPECASNPENVPTIEQCTALPNTQCYTRINKGNTERGCVSSLSKALMLNCLSANSADCVICNDDKCNVEIYPADRRQCHRCNSKDDPSCESTPNAASICPFYSANEGCATKSVNGHIYRDCSSEFECDPNDLLHCRMCYDSDNCNSVDLQSNDVGFPGKFQAVPINCYTCFGTECHGTNKGLVRKCLDNDRQTCGTVFAANGTVVQRGCSDQVFSDEFAIFCSENPDSCKFCTSNGCNIATSLDDYIDCVYCDGAEDANCIFNVDEISETRSCYKQCMTGFYPRADEEDPAYEVSRGCLDDMDLDDREECASSTKTHCKACSGANCNKETVLDEYKKCFFCNGDCDDVVSMECTAFRENDQCFTLFDNENSVQRMGCASDLDTSYITENRRWLLLCDNDNCNTFSSFPQGTGCAWCNSANDPDCVANPEKLTKVACDNLPFTQCFTQVDKVGLTHRGCLSDLNDENFADCISGDSTTCSICSVTNCNTALYPTDRRSCHRCNSENDADCNTNPSDYAAVCPIYNVKENCVTKLEGDQLLRGCSSDFTCDTSSRDTCRICDSDNCNVIDLLEAFVGEPGTWQALPLNCYVCEGAECLTGFGSIHKCEGNNLQTCVTVFDAEGTVEKRGCSDDVAQTHEQYCDEHADKCLPCKSSGCNEAASLDDYVDCYFCDSSSTPGCSVNIASLTRTRKCHKSCMVALYPRSSAINPAYEMSRSCLDDMDLDDREDCVAGKKEFCKACDDSRCNTMAIPDERHECYKCAGDDCENAAVQQCSAHQVNDQCYIMFDDENSIAGMGCRSEFEMNAVTDLIKQKKMILCDGKNCNSLNTVPTTKMCSVCTSENDPRCATNPNLVEYTERCSLLPYTECFTRVNDRGHTERGCLASLESETFYGCLMTSDKLCEVCEGDKCNEIDVFPKNRMECHQCSSATDPLCSASPNSNTVCPLYVENDACVTNLRNGITTRGCASSLKCDNENDKRTCRKCNGAGCNTANLEKVSADGEPGRWQDVPITCYTCKGEEDCSSQTSPGIFRPCTDNPYQNCMTVFDAEGKVIQRGCSDNVEADNQAYCDANTGKCLGCNSNGCNFATRLEDYVECLSCESDSDGNCVTNTNAISKTRMCHKHCMTALYPREIEENPAYGLTRSCYDDMDLDERDACEAGDNENCKICSDAKCNTIALPEIRHSCYICEGEKCQDPSPQTCTTYRPNDKCYIRYDEQNSIVAMGCRSEFSNADADYLLKKKRLFLCEANNCNTFDALPSAQRCTLCNSRTDLKCAIDPEDVDGSTNCAIVPFTECYSRVLSDGATERGCLSNLEDDDFLSCLDGTSPTCTPCKNDNCNNQIYPSERVSCHICDSSNDPNCESSPNSLSICPKYNAADTCVTSFQNDVTYRGCSSSLTCDPGNGRSCVKCSGDGCNTINLAKKQDDNFGKWQDLPLQCLTCSGSDCKSESTTTTATCENNNEQDCLTIFDENGEVVRRGCSDNVEVDYGSYCDANADSCYNCKSNECNSAEAQTEFTDCVYCNSHKDLSCIYDPLTSTHKTRKCQGGCMTALYPSDGNANPAYDLIRTCLSDKEAVDQTTCSNGKDANCAACEGDKCNTADLPPNRLQCYICDGEDCEDPIPKRCPLHKKDDMCFIWLDNSNNINQMGCISSFRNQDLEVIIKTKEVFVCTGTNCNTLDNLTPVQKCAVCDSKDNRLCATNAIEIGTINTCSQMPYTSCYSKLTSSGTTIRGCLTDLPGDDFAACVLGKDANCETCVGDACNRAVYPAERLQCYSCSTDENENCESLPSRALPCPYVTTTESCITALDGNVTLRGCSSDILCNAQDSFGCRPCVGTECNTIDLRNLVDDGYHGTWQSLPLRCHTCEGDHCKNSLGPALICQNNNNQDCMTVFDETGEIIRRGCSDDVETYKQQTCKDHPELCFKCKSNECNAAWEITEYVQCAFCNSETDAMCAVNPENSGFDTRACYKECMVAMKNGIVSRSCLDDKELFVQHECQTNSENDVCATCEDSNCNKFVFPKDRLKCHVCTGSTCSSSIGQYCRLYDKNDFCFAKYENGKVDLMGCATSQNSTDIEQWTQQNRLYRCDGNDCNDLTKLPTEGLCLLCDSSKTPNCAQYPSQITTTELCNAPNGQCITRIDTAGHTLRGCFGSSGEQESCIATGTCSVCSGDKCNNQIFPANRRKCHICNSVADENCAKNPSSTKYCQTYTPNDNCVARNTDGYIERGCGTDLTCDASDEKYCQVCQQDLCNTADVSSAALLTSSLILTLLLAYVATALGFNQL